jgi:hypothetical protein
MHSSRGFTIRPLISVGHGLYWKILRGVSTTQATCFVIRWFTGPGDLELWDQKNIFFENTPRINFFHLKMQHNDSNFQMP